jgi:hypothetical protein
VKIRDGAVAGRLACIVSGVNCHGERDVLGLWAHPRGSRQGCADAKRLRWRVGAPITGRPSAMRWPSLALSPLCRGGGAYRWWPRLVDDAPDLALVGWQLVGGAAALVGAENTRRTQKVSNVSPGQGVFGRSL